MKQAPAAIKTPFVEYQEPTPLLAPSIEYHVITYTTQSEKLDKNPVYIGITWEDYLRIAQFEKEKLAYVKNLRAVIAKYKEYLRSKSDVQFKPED